MTSKIFFFILVALLPHIIVKLCTGRQAHGHRVPRDNTEKNTITDDELRELSELLFTTDTSDAWKFVTTSPMNCNRHRPQPILMVNPAVKTLPTIQSLYKVFDLFYNTLDHETKLIKMILDTEVMSKAMKFLEDKQLIKKLHDFTYLNTVTNLWLERYKRGRNFISYGLQHVFLLDKFSNTDYRGMHNWIFYNFAENTNKAHCLKYLDQVKLGNKVSILKIQAEYKNVKKIVTTMFVGTSPELEIALYTVCAFARPNMPCPLSIGNTPFNVLTYTFTHQDRYVLGSAYPLI